MTTAPGAADHGSADATPVALTARWIAAARAHESARPNRLFNDPYADTLAGVTGLSAAESAPAAGRDTLILAAIRRYGSPYLVIRTRFFDDLLLGAVAPPASRQVVILAAGMDTRAFRLAWPAGTRLFELDQPAVLAAKAAALVGAEPACVRRTLGVDLAQPSWPAALRDAGFDAGQPSAWLVEGLLMYLEPAAVDALLRAVAGLATPGSVLGADLFNSAVLTAPLVRFVPALIAAQGAPWRFATDAPEALFAAAGWEATVRRPGDAGAAYGRWRTPVVPRALRLVPQAFLIGARRTAAGPAEATGAGA